MTLDARPLTGQREVPGMAPGHVIALNIPDGDVLRHYRSRLLSRAWAEGELVVGWPHDDAFERLPLRQGQTVVVEAFPALDALYVVETTVVSARPELPDQVVVQVRGPWQRIQRRDAVRFPVRIAPHALARLNGPGETLNGSIRDLSAGGLRLWSGQRVEPGDRLRVRFRLPGEDTTIDTALSVERVEFIASQTIELWEAGCLFVGIAPAERERIVRFIFAQQRAVMQLRRETGELRLPSQPL